MKGIGVTILQLLWGNVMQRGLLAVGLVLTLTGIAGLHYGWHPDAAPLFGAADICGMVAIVAYPIMIDALLFRWLSAPRAVRLIPRGKLKLLLGAFSSQLLLALFIGFTLGALRPSGLTKTMAVVAFTGVSAIFLSSYWGFASPRRVRLWTLFILFPILIPVALTKTQLRELIVSPTGLGVQLIVTLIAWSLFAVTYMRAGRILPPQLNRRAADKIAPGPAWSLLSLGLRRFAPCCGDTSPGERSESGLEWFSAPPTFSY